MSSNVDTKKVYYLYHSLFLKLFSKSVIALLDDNLMTSACKIYLGLQQDIIYNLLFGLQLIKHLFKLLNLN